jgi:hypothetical protein
MANPSEFHEQTRVLAAPANAPDVLPLPVLITADMAERFAMPGCVSAWQLTPDEMAEVQRTGVVYLAVLGTSHPPVFVGAELEQCLQVMR